MKKTLIAILLVFTLAVTGAINSQTTKAAINDNSFAAERIEILAEIKEEIAETTGDEQTNLQKLLQDLENTQNEDDFWDILEAFYDFETERNEIIDEIKEEITEVTGDEKAELEKLLSDLEKAQTEDEFWDVLESFYFFDEDYNFEEERKEILEEIKEEIEYTTGEEKDDLIKGYNILASITDEDEFWNTFDELYEAYEAKYYNFETERTEVLEEIKEESIALAQLYDSLYVIQDEDEFWNALDAFYENFYGEYDDEDFEEEDFEDDDF